MSASAVELTAPNGIKYTQPTGLFINNEFVKAKSGQTITSIDPAYVSTSPIEKFFFCLLAVATMY